LINIVVLSFGQERILVTAPNALWNGLPFRRQNTWTVKDLELQNRCLLMKFINKLYSDENPSWKNWILTIASSETFTSQSPSYLWNIINDELNSFRSITYVKVKNRATTSFWFDHWIHSGPLSSTCPTLFSHITRPDVSV
jgi:hypothetical protein